LPLRGKPVGQRLETPDRRKTGGIANRLNFLVLGSIGEPKIMLRLAKQLLNKPSEPMAIGVNRAFELATEAGFFYGRSEGILSVNAIVGEISRTDIPVLLQGESGTGKEVYGRLIHQLSAVRDLPLVKLSCTVLEPGELLVRLKTSLGNRSGESGDGCGTLFLDGIDELDLDCQRILLATLQEQEMATGGRMGFRLISTTTRNLDREIGLGRFRRELYFRISGVCIKLPPLRERREDLATLMEYFLEKHALEAGKQAPVLSQEDEELLRAHDWPGNIRELGNLARKVVALGQSRLTMNELKRSVAVQTNGAEVANYESLKVVAREASRVAERELILKALERTHWNRKQAARELQVSYKALLYKIKQMDVDGDQLKRLRGEEE
jgi:two-component system, NtrC family, response regulator AtoC